MNDEAKALLRRLGLAVLLSSIALSAAAHHSGAEYDYGRPVTLSGVVTKMEWANPHSHIYIMVSDGRSAPTTWELVLPSVNRLVRLGWTRHALNPGDRVTITAARERSSPNTAAALKVIAADGRKLFVGSPDGRSQ